MPEQSDKKIPSDWGLFQCAKFGSGQELREAISKGADVNARDDEGKTLLVHAAQNGNEDAVKALIEVGVDVNARDRSGKSALMFAVGGGSADIAKILLAAGANVNACDNDGATAIAHAEDNRVVIDILRLAGGRNPKKAGQADSNGSRVVFHKT